MGSIKRSSKDIYVSDVPDNLPRDQKIQILDAIEASGKPFTGTFADATSMAYNIPQGEEAPLNREQVAKQVEQEQQIAEEEAPKTTVKGALDSFARNVAPTAIAAAVGLPVAAAERVAYYLSKPIADFVNNTFKLEGTPYEQMNSQEMYDYIHDKLGLEKADTPVERVAGAAGTGVSEGLGTLGTAGVLEAGGKLIQSGGTLLNPLKSKIGQMVEGSGKIIADLPTKEIAASLGATAGAQTGLEIAESQDMGPIKSALVSLGVGVLGSISASQLDDLAKAVSKLMSARGADLPEAAAAIIRQTEARGVDTVLSDFRPTKRLSEDRRTIREMASRGTRDIRFEEQAPQRVEMLRNLADEFDVDIDNPNVSGHLEDVAADFFAKRDEELTTLTTAKREVLDNLADTEVPRESLQETLDVIDSARARLISGGDDDMKPFINKLTNWEAMLEGNDLNQLEAHRETIGKAFMAPELAGLKNDTNQKTVNEIYRSLRKNMGEYIAEAGGPMEGKKFEEAMSGLSDLSKDFSTEGISALMNNRSTPTAAVQRIILNGEPDVIRNLYPRLSPEGQANARTSLIAKMIDDSITHGDISPNKFAKKVKNYSGQHGVLFSQEDGVHLETIKKVLDRTSRAEQEQLLKDVMPGEGLQGVNRLVTGIVARNPVAAIPTLLASKLGRGAILKWMERPAMRDLLLKYDAIPNVARYSDAQEEVLKRMSELVRGYAQAEMPEGDQTEETQQRARER